MDNRYQRDERRIMWLSAVLGTIVGVLAFFLGNKIGDDGAAPLSPVTVWAHIEAVAPQSGIDPEFVYALAWAESSLKPKARSSVARGIMQLTEAAWREATDEPYRRAWNWRDNIRVGVEYLAFCRDFLRRHDAFSYPLLAAAYRYGPYYVKGKDFDLAQVKPPKNEIYQRIFAGDSRPVEPPE